MILWNQRKANRDKEKINSSCKFFCGLGLVLCKILGRTWTSDVSVMSQFFPNFKNPSVPDPNHQDIEIHGVSVWIICVGGCFYTVYKL